MQRIVIPTIIIALTAFTASFVLSHIDAITRPSIKRQEREKEQRALGKVLPGYKVGEKQTITQNGASLEYWVGEKEAPDHKAEDKPKKKKKKDKEKRYAYAFITSEPGYSGDIKSMVGVDDRGKILGISILEQTETPGLGARCTEAASSLTFLDVITGKDVADEGPGKPWFQLQYKGLTLLRGLSVVKKGDWKPSMKEELLKMNSISAITGATITARTVTDSIEKGFALLKSKVDFAAHDQNKKQKEEKK